MIAKSGTMMLAVLVVGTGLLGGAAQPAEAKMSDTAKVVAAFAAGFVLADVLADDGPHHHAPRHCGSTHHCGYRPSAHVVRIEHRPVWRPQHGCRPAHQHGYRTGYRDGYRDGYKDGWQDRDRARHTGWR
jgi:hypothetical protein